MIDDKKFLEARKFGAKGYCHMKLTNPKGGMPEQFGVISKEWPLTVRLCKANGRLSGEEIKFESVDAILAAGWLVD